MQGSVDLAERPREGGFTGKAPSDEVELSGVVLEPQNFTKDVEGARTLQAERGI